MLFSERTSSGTSESTAVGAGLSCFIHVYSASTSACTVLIQQSLDKIAWYTVATIINPTSTGELWRGPSLSNTRVNISSYSSGTISAAVDFSGVETSQWEILAGAKPSVGTAGLIKYDVTNAALVSLGGAGTVSSGNLPIGTLPAYSRVLATYINVTSAEDSANNFTGSLGVAGTAYTDWLAACDMKSAVLYGDATADRGATNIDGCLMYTTVKPIYAQFIKTTTHLHDLTNFAATVYVHYVTYPT